MTILSTYSGGYTLAAGGILTITKTGTIGGTGLAADAGSTTVNQGLIETAAQAGGAGLAGTAAARLTGTGVTLANSGMIVGGTGGSGANGYGAYSYGAGHGGKTGGAGGSGVTLASGSMTNTRSILGGTGGAGGAGAYGKFTGGRGGYGEVGGAAVTIDSATVTNTGTLTGGAGGVGGIGGPSALTGGNGRSGGIGGPGVQLDTGKLVNRGVIVGGAGGVGGKGGSGALGGGSNGGTQVNGDGVDTYGVGTIVNAAGGVISGYFGVSGVFGPITLINFGTIIGEGRDCVDFSDIGNEIIAEPGSVFVGLVGGTLFTLDGGVGTITNLGSMAMLTGAVSADLKGFSSYDITSGGAWTLAGSSSLAASQTLTVGAGAIVRLSGSSLADGGVVQVTGLSTAVARLLINGADTISGGGTVVLNGAGHIVASASGGALTIAGATLSGGGAIEGSLSIANDAGSVIDADSGVMLIDTGKTLANAGAVESAGSGTLLLRDTVLGGGGVVTDGHKLQLDGASISDGSLSIAAGALLQSTTHGGAIDLGGGTVANAGTIDGALGGLTITGDVANAGLVEAVNGSLTVSGAIGGAGSTRIFGTGVLEVEGALGQNVTFAAGNGAALILADSADFTGKVYGFSKLDVIELSGLSLSSDTFTYAGSAAGGTLTVRDSALAVVATIKFSGDYLNGAFQFGAQGAHSGVVFVPVAAPAASRLSASMAAFAPTDASAAVGWEGPPTPRPALLAVRLAG